MLVLPIYQTFFFSFLCVILSQSQVSLFYSLVSTVTLFRGVLGKIVNSSVYALAVIDLVTSIVINLSSAPFSL